MREHRYTYATTIQFDGDEPFAELEVEVSYTVAWGSPESGRFGPPEHYDPGSPSVVEDIRVERVEGHERPWRLHPGGDDALVAAILAALEDERDAMLAEAAEEDAAAYEDAMERRTEEAREERW